MTRETFLRGLRGLRGKGWQPYNGITMAARLSRLDISSACPITALAMARGSTRYTLDQFSQAAKFLGLHNADRNAIVDAADSERVFLASPKVTAHHRRLRHAILRALELPR